MPKASLCHRRIFNQIINRPKLERKQIALQSVKGDPVPVDGVADITFKIAGISITHTFYVVPTLNRNILLGRDFLKQNNVRLYFDLGKMRIHGRYVNLDEDVHMMTLVRLKQALVVKPQTAALCHGKVPKYFNANGAPFIGMTSINRGFIANQPGLMVANSLTHSSQ